MAELGGGLAGVRPEECTRVDEEPRTRRHGVLARLLLLLAPLLLVVPLGAVPTGAATQTAHFLPFPAETWATINQIVGPTHICPGSFCEAIDFGLDGGPVHASAAGTIIGLKKSVPGQTEEANWGNYVLLAHTDGTCSRYAHLAAGTMTGKNRGQKVGRGEYLGREGNTGSTYPKGRGQGFHLHYQLERCSTGQSVPVAFVEMRAQSLRVGGSVMSMNPVAGSDDAEAIAWMLGNGISTGVRNRGFAPEDLVTRAEAAAFIWRYAGSPRERGRPFDDVPDRAFYADSVAWMAANGITKGLSNERFGPQVLTSRGQWLTMLWRLEGEPRARRRSSFTDVPRDAYYAKAVDWLVAEKILRPGGELGPDESITRRDLARVLWEIAGQPPA